MPANRESLEAGARTYDVSVPKGGWRHGVFEGPPLESGTGTLADQAVLRAVLLCN
jgi:hypothetical protein